MFFIPWLYSLSIMSNPSHTQAAAPSAAHTIPQATTDTTDLVLLIFIHGYAPYCIIVSQGRSFNDATTPQSASRAQIRHSGNSRNVCSISCQKPLITPL